MSTDSASLPHLTSEELAAYLDDRLDSRSIARLESHLSDCRECRAELVATRALVESSIATTDRRLTAPAIRARTWLAAAAVIAITVLPLIGRSLHSRSDTAPVRATPERPPAIAVLAPDNRSADAARVTFVWRPVESARTCRLTVTDSAGAPLFTVATSDTVVSPPANGHLERGTSYLWYLDCLTSDGVTVSSGIRSFATDR
ncbi:MAG TPA: zf-HC2 domain-containing protein [Gemmatimonadaceae bacterium]|jgi:anti-sigma factor RsiW